MRKALRPVKVQRPKFSEDCSEVFKERSGWFHTEKSTPCKNASMLNTLEGASGDHRWWTQIGTLSAKQFTKELERKSGKSCIATTVK